MKRRVAALASAGRDKEAIEALAKYLDTFMADTRAWERLAGMYQERGAYRQAVFCWEEVVAAEPSCTTITGDWRSACTRWVGGGPAGGEEVLRRGGGHEQRHGREGAVRTRADG